MSKNLKRFVTILMAVVMVLGTSVMAFADTDDTGAATTNATGEYYTLPIRVTVPTEAAFKLNPGRIKVSENGTERDDAVLSTPGQISNNTVMNLRAAVQIKSTPKGVELVKTEATNSKDKTANVKYGVAVASENAVSGNHIIKKSEWDLSENTDEDNKSEFILTDKDTDSFNDVWFAFYGTVAADPDTAWKAGDKVDVELKYTFAPVDININANVPATFNAE